MRRVNGTYIFVSYNTYLTSSITWLEWPDALYCKYMFKFRLFISWPFILFSLHKVYSRGGISEYSLSPVVNTSLVWPWDLVLISLDLLSFAVGVPLSALAIILSTLDTWCMLVRNFSKISLQLTTLFGFTQGACIEQVNIVVLFSMLVTLSLSTLFQFSSDSYFILRHPWF